MGRLVTKPDFLKKIHFRDCNQIGGFFKLEYLLIHITYQPKFLYVKSYQLWLEPGRGILVKYAKMKLWAWSGIPRHVQSLPK